MTRENILKKVLNVYPHYLVTKQNELADRLMSVEALLRPNIEEWLLNKPLSDIWVRDKYCVGAVMNIRQDDDFVSAIIALDDYLKDESAEQQLWQLRL